MNRWRPYSKRFVPWSPEIRRFIFIEQWKQDKAAVYLNFLNNVSFSTFLNSTTEQKRRLDNTDIHTFWLFQRIARVVSFQSPPHCGCQRTTCFRATPRPGGRKSSRFLRSRSFFWVRGSASLGVGPGPAVKARTVRFRAGPGIVPSSSNLTALVLAWLESWKHL